MAVTVTHNREERRRDGWQGEREATAKGVGGEGVRPLPKTGAERGEDDAQRDQREGDNGNGGRLGGWEPGAP